MSVVAPPPPSFSTLTTPSSLSCSSARVFLEDMRSLRGGEPSPYLSSSSSSPSSAIEVDEAASSSSSSASSSCASSCSLESLHEDTDNKSDHSNSGSSNGSSSSNGSDSSCESCECESPTGSDYSESSESGECVSTWDAVRLVSHMQQMQQQQQSPSQCGVILPVDVRTQEKYNEGHIAGAVSAVCSGLHLRRLKSGTLPVENVVSTKQRKFFRESKAKATIVVYDQSSSSFCLDDASSPLSVICARLASEGSRVVFLRGGFAAFADQFPLEVEKSSLPNPVAFRGLLDSTLKISSPPPSNPTSCLQAPLTKVLPYLFLGSQYDARNEALLSSHGIRYVLNVTLDCPNYFESAPGFKYKQICIKDAWNQNIAEYFQAACEFIEQARTEKVSVLVHCAAGISRSATIVLAYLMNVKRCSLNAAFSTLKELRSTISPNLDFMGHLLQYQKTLGIPADSGYDSPASGSELSPAVLAEAAVSKKDRNHLDVPSGSQTFLHKHLQEQQQKQQQRQQRQQEDTAME